MAEMLGAPDTIRTCGLCLRRAVDWLKIAGFGGFFGRETAKQARNRARIYGKFTGNAPEAL